MAPSVLPVLPQERCGSNEEEVTSTAVGSDTSQITTVNTNESDVHQNLIPQRRRCWECNAEEEEEIQNPSNSESDDPNAGKKKYYCPKCWEKWELQQEKKRIRLR
jgi:hypothetical protein